MDKWYAFKLDDYATVSFVSSSKLYIGTLEDFGRLLEGDESENFRGAYEELKKGNTKVKVNVAYSEVRFAEPIKLIKERTIELGGGVYNHTNIYGFPYDVGYDKGKLTKYLFKFQKKYFVAYRLSLDSPRVEEEDFKPIYLIDRFWGFPGLIKKVRQGEKKLDFTIENTLLEIEKRTNNLSEAEKIFLSEDLDFSDFFNDIFGDG